MAKRLRHSMTFAVALSTLIACSAESSKSDRSANASATTKKSAGAKAEPETTTSSDAQSDETSDKPNTGFSDEDFAQMFLVDSLDTDDASVTLKLAADDDADTDTDADVSDDDVKKKLFNRVGIIKLIANQLMTRADTDKSKDLSLTEFEAFRVNTAKLSDAAIARINEHRKKVFEAADADKDDKLTPAEIEAMIKNLGKHVFKLHAAHGGIKKHLEERWKKTLETYDADKDGKLNDDERKAMQTAELADMCKHMNEFFDKTCKDSAGAQQMCAASKLVMKACVKPTNTSPVSTVVP